MPLLPSSSENGSSPCPLSVTRPRSSRGIGYHKEGCFPSEDDFLVDWCGIVEEYTGRSMTFQKDKLIAIKGTADAVAPILSRTYFVGFWIESHRSILMGLLWVSRRPKTGYQRLDIAPSWSWPSTAGTVSWPGHWLCRLQSRISILDLKLFDTASRASAELVVETHIRAGRKDKNLGFSVLDWPSAQAADASCPRNWPLNGIETPVFLDENLPEGSPVWFAEIAAREVHVRGNRKEVHCLVLVESGKESMYRRVGYSTWPESSWMNMEFPERRRISLTIV